MTASAVVRPAVVLASVAVAAFDDVAAARFDCKISPVYHRTTAPIQSSLDESGRWPRALMWRARKVRKNSTRQRLRIVLFVFGFGAWCKKIFAAAASLC